MGREVAYLDLGTISYGECWELQRQLFDNLVAAKMGDVHGLPQQAVAGRSRENGELREAVSRNIDGGLNMKYNMPAQQYLLLCEHPPVYTLGKSGNEGNMLATEEFLKDRGAEFYHIDRGGDITFHGPGQLVGYPILDLETEGMGLREYIHTLEQCIIDTVAEYGITAGRVEGAAGVWLTGPGPLSNNGEGAGSNRAEGTGSNSTGAMRKICAIGVKSSRYVTMHGFALNANTDLEWFRLINPCGFTDRGVTSIARETGQEVDMEELKSIFKKMFMKNFDIKIKQEDYANREKLGNQATGRREQSG